MAKPPDSTPQTFEAALAELEAIVATMEDGQLPLAEALAAYKRGAELLQYCQRRSRTPSAAGASAGARCFTAFAPGEPDTGTKVSDRSAHRRGRCILTLPGLWSGGARGESESVVDGFLPPATEPPQRLHKAMRYAVLGGGKRVRALLAYAAGELTSADLAVARRAAPRSS
jgi:exodeoxyribonuclease VII small subunit